MLMQPQTPGNFDELVLADEINRATPKTQSALLEAMSVMLQANLPST